MGKHTTPKFIIGLGASAGGLEALENFFDKAPDDSDAAFVVVMHLSRDFKSMLDELLARHTKMPVKPAIDGEKLSANTVYIIQPATTIEMDGLKFKVQSRPVVDLVGAVTTIDDFFRSLANEWGDKSCGIVLSGSGSDGAEGIISIRQAGGFTCAQSPETAKFDSMPLAAISTNSVRAIDAPEQLGAIAVDGMVFPSAEPYVAILSDHDKALAKILTAVVGISDIDAGQYKHSMFERRVRKRMMHLQIGSLTAYADLVSKDLIEAKTLAETLLIGVTQFFRDEAAFRIIKQQIVPELIQQAQNEKRQIRIWTPGCATGQEAYSFAMLFAEAFQDLPEPIDVQIFATDIKRDFLGIAARGEFTEEQVGSIPASLLEKFFSKSGESEFYLVDPDIRKMIVFAPHDILSDPPFTRLDMVSCRNMLIYFSIEAQQKILSGFAFGLNEKGILFLGSSETVGAHREAFEFIDAKNRIFRRTPLRRSTQSSYQAPLDALRGSTRLGTSRRTVKLRETALQPAYTAMLDEYAPASLLLSSERELLHSFGAARNYLRPPDGVAHFDAADMVDKALRSPLIAGVERCLRDRAPISFTKIRLDQFPEPDAFVDIELKPLVNDEHSDPEHVLVIIDSGSYKTDEANLVPVSVIQGDKIAEERVEKLELELDRTREALQSTIEEIETTNEELQSSNEELMSSNEELQSTNEELSSVNEELYSVNAEYHRQNDELTNLSSDFDLLLQSTEIGVIFLDKDLKITRFTALAGDIFSLADTDIGRPISTFRSPFKDIDPDSLVYQALSENKIVEVEVSDRDNVAWLIRSVAHEGRQGGAVLTIINIGRLRDAEAENRRTNSMLASMQRITQSFFYEINPENWTILREVGLTKFVGAKESVVGARFDSEIMHEEDRESVIELLSTSADYEAELLFQARLWHEETQKHRYIKFIALKSDNNNWHVTGMDIDELIHAQKMLEEREAVFEGVLRASPSLVSYIGNDEKYIYVNHAYEKQWDQKAKDIVGSTVEAFLPQTVYAQAKAKIKSALAGERQSYIVNGVDNGGKAIKLSVVYEPVFDTENNVKGFVTDALDVTEFYRRSDDIKTFEQLLGNSVDRFHYAVLIVDTKLLTVDYANPSALARLGFSKDQDVPDGVKISRLTPTWGDQAWKSWFKSHDDGDDLLKRDISVFGQDGSNIDADFAATLIEVGGKQKAILRIFDNSERVLALQDLQSRSEELAMSNRDLEQFASVVAHDLRAPLRHITQFSSMVREEIDAESDSLPEYLDIISSSATKMSDMVDGLLSYARLGRERPVFEKKNLLSSVKTAKSLLAAEISETSAKIETKTLGKVYGNEDLLSRLFQNLIGNSLKYRKPNIPPKVKIYTERTDNSLKLYVEDNGIGIAPEYAESVFKLFGRLHSDDAYEGLGVGLATCRRIAEMHNGKIRLDTDYSDGCRFIVEIPQREV